MSTFVVHGIVTEDLQMRKVCAKLVSKVLSQDQKEPSVLRCQELLDLIQNEPDFLNSVATGDESWMFEYDPESKRQSCAWHTKSSPRPKKARMSKSRITMMIIVFFDIRGIVHSRQLIPHDLENPIPIPKTVKESYIKKDDQHTAFADNHQLEDPEFISNESGIPHLFDQALLNDLVKALGLSKEAEEILGSRLKQRRARLNWCLEHHAWTHDQWANVLFSDESRFSLNTDSRRVFIWREPGTRYHPSNIREIDSFRSRQSLSLGWHQF
ncbi:hypothetical protein LAZ67_1003756 [Cordylochernes scorpioides]|uniref:Transposase n=1 Tax=Cordylochernes scorpioides TaxID=51811 RepID=A0ABY6JYQ7_9ARAC|nr:hypothetical protein LAZ67_1003756 [Cordylochernes scorpioides]